MDRKYNKKLIPLSKTLRKNMTKEEKHLWYDCLRNYPVKFLRQKVLGRYIVDFYCAKANLVIELDGEQHYSPVGKYKDQKRTEYLQKYGLKVVRILNRDINQNFSDVCTYIDILVRERLSGEKKD